MRTNQRLVGKVALVTGAARGIGQGIARCLAEEGADIVVNDLPVAQGGSDPGPTAAAIAALGQEALVVQANIADREQVAALFTQALQRFDRIDIVVANAARSLRAPVIEASWPDVLQTIEVTQFGVFHTCQSAAQHLVATNGDSTAGGKIIIIGSILADIPLLQSAPYNMAKAAIVQFGRTLAAELAPQRINVNIVNPGWIDTPGERAFNTEAQLVEGARAIPWGRLGTPDDIGRAVAYLASDDADYVTGSVLEIDGGYRLGMRLPSPP